MRQRGKGLSQVCAAREELALGSGFNKVNFTVHLVILNRVAQLKGEAGMLFYSGDK